MEKEIRTRFAPSPTGFMHVGGIRTALFGWLFARSKNGTFVLRIEDTDKAREVEGSVAHIQEALNWLGLNTDEGPEAGGDYAPYLQSERLDIYRQYAQQLIDKGLAYVDPYTTEQVAEFREVAKAEKKPFLYRNYRPEHNVVPDDWYKNHSLRFKVSNVKRYTWNDIVRGELSAGEEALDDFVLIKSDGYPTYNFAHIVDDEEMKISHVIRGEEFIPSVPKYLSLYEALELEVPEFITVPPILNVNGGKKLSKRDGSKDVLEYRAAGYLPESVNNFLASLGWNDGTEKEIFDMSELISAFTPDRIQKSGAKFDETKLEWIEWQHRKAQIEKDANNVLKVSGIENSNLNEDFAQLALSKARSLAEFLDQYQIYIEIEPFVLTDDSLGNIDKNLNHDVAKEYLSAAIDVLKNSTDFSEQDIESVLRKKMEELGASPRAFLNLIRWSITNRKVSPNLFQIISLLGKEKTFTRLEASLKEQA